MCPTVLEPPIPAGKVFHCKVHVWTTNSGRPQGKPALNFQEWVSKNSQNSVIGPTLLLKPSAVSSARIHNLLRKKHGSMEMKNVSGWSRTRSIQSPRAVTASPSPVLLQATQRPEFLLNHNNVTRRHTGPSFRVGAQDLMMWLWVQNDWDAIQWIRPAVQTETGKHWWRTESGSIRIRRRSASDRCICAESSNILSRHHPAGS